jgi:hypothetical protein
MKLKPGKCIQTFGNLITGNLDVFGKIMDAVFSIKNIFPSPSSDSISCMISSNFFFI